MHDFIELQSVVTNLLRGRSLLYGEEVPKLDPDQPVLYIEHCTECLEVFRRRAFLLYQVLHKNISSINSQINLQLCLNSEGNGRRGSFEVSFAKRPSPPEERIRIWSGITQMPRIQKFPKSEIILKCLKTYMDLNSSSHKNKLPSTGRVFDRQRKRRRFQGRNIKQKDEKAEKNEKTEKTEKTEKNEKIEKNEKTEKPLPAPSSTATASPDASSSSPQSTGKRPRKKRRTTTRDEETQANNKSSKSPQLNSPPRRRGRPPNLRPNLKYVSYKI